MDVWICCRECDAVFKSASKSTRAFANSLNFECCPECGEKN